MTAQPGGQKLYSGPVWRRENQWPRSRIPPALRRWLLDTASLTDRIRRACTGGFRVRVLDQGWGYPGLDERRVLDMPQGQRAIIRQVQLLCDEAPWVFARSVIPVMTLRGRQRRLAHLGNRPLGAYLFADPSMRRGPVQLARLTPRQSMYATAIRGLATSPAEIWGRRSVFRLGDRPLLVCEVFLPGLMQPASSDCHEA